jgi:[protein-PII] uridylyltransferase
MKAGFNRDVGWINGRALRRKLGALTQEHQGDGFALRHGAANEVRRLRLGMLSCLEAELNSGSPARTVIRAHALGVDVILHALYDCLFEGGLAINGKAPAIAAIGGYGRGELFPHSDLDLTFLCYTHNDPALQRLAEPVVQILWDSGFEVGQSARSIDETIEAAKDDWAVATAFLDLRPIAGDADLVSQVRARLATDVMNARAAEFVAAKLGEREARLKESGGDSRYMVEPDVKNGKGGLRDLHLIEWLAHGVAMARGERHGDIHDFRVDDAARFDAAAEFLARVRCHLHLVAGKGEERLGFDLQPLVARHMGYVEQEGPNPEVEAFMRDYFLTTRAVGQLTRILCARLEATDTKSRPLGLMGRSPEMPCISEDSDPRFDLAAGRLHFRARDVALRPLADALGLIIEAARRGVDVHPDAWAETTEIARFAEGAERSDPEVTTAFLAAFHDPSRLPVILRALNDTGLLGTIVPEFGDIVARTQFNMYHRFTVDEHTLHVIHALCAFLTGKGNAGQELAARAADGLENVHVLLMAALLHDVGKGHGDQQEAGAERAERACLRLGMEPAEVDRVSWLVGHHLLMSDTAQRRDLSDPATIRAFASEVANIRALRELTLLTLSDMEGVGPGVLNEWKVRLLTELYDLTLASLRGGRAHAGHVEHLLKEQAEEARKNFAARQHGTNSAMSWALSVEYSYWINTDEAAQDRHFTAAMGEPDREWVSARWTEEQGIAELIVVAEDCPGLFRRLTRALAASGANIRRARGFNLGERRILDVFAITLGQCDHRDVEALEGVAGALRQALAGQAFDAKPKQRIRGSAARRAAAFTVSAHARIDNNASDIASVIEISGRDRPGLLADIAALLDEHALDVISVHVDSIGERVLDVFYVREREGSPFLNAHKRTALTRHLRNLLSQSDEAVGEVARLPRARASVLR